MIHVDNAASASRRHETRTRETQCFNFGFENEARVNFVSHEWGITYPRRKFRRVNLPARNA